MRKLLLEILRNSIEVVEPYKLVKKQVILNRDIFKIKDNIYNINDFNKIIVIGGGKATASIACAIEEIFKDKISDGIINVKYGYREELRKIRIIEAGHPIPDKKGVDGTKEIIKLINKKEPNNLILCLISGGGSALLCSPSDGITLKDKQITTDLLLKCGANIEEINIVRKHISKVKGGRIVRLAYPAKVISLILSDVIGDKLDIIASGPTVADRSYFKDAMEVLKKYELWNKIPGSVKNHIEAGPDETPKPGDKIFDRVDNMIIGNNLFLLTHVKRLLEGKGFNSIILSSIIEGEAREVAKFHASIVKEILITGNPIPPPAAIISGGELTVTVKGSGIGGRNLEFSLAMAQEIQGLNNIIGMSIGTDGTDGPTNAAGAFFDGSTIDRKSVV